MNTQAKETLEIMRTRLWHVDPRFAHQVRPTIEAYLNRQNEMDVEDNYHASGWFALKSKGFNRTSLLGENISGDLEVSEDLIVTNDPKYDMTQHWWEEEGPLISPDDEFINVIDMTSSVTRNGGWCSAGSIEHRDQMIFASKFANCIGHIFIIDTPGGSAYSKNDYQQGIEAARMAGQPVICWIDGMCCSAGVAAACQTDEIYVQHSSCEVGCIGTMAAFYTLADGSKDEDGYVYHELYDPESFEKNLEFRELANNGNADPLLADLAEDGEDFRELVKKNRPAMDEEMLHGKVYKARDLMGKLVDGVKSFEQVVERLTELRMGAELVKHEIIPMPEEPENPIIEDPQDKCGDKDDEKPKDKCGDKDKDKQSNKYINAKLIMEKYTHLTKAMGLAENQQLAATEEGFFCNDALAEAADAYCAKAEEVAVRCKASEEALVRANETIAELNTEVETLKNTIAESETTIAELNKQIEEGAEKAESSSTASAEQIATLESEKEELATANVEKDAEIASLKEQLAAKDAELEEMSKVQTQSPVPTPAVASEAPAVSNAAHIYHEGMTAAERQQAYEARMNQLRSRF